LAGVLGAAAALTLLAGQASAQGDRDPHREHGAEVARPADAPADALPERIVSLTPSVTEILFALGIGQRVVGVSDYCDEPERVRTLPRVGSFLDPVVEVVVHLEPDLVITSRSPGNKAPVRAIERTGVKVGVVSEGSQSVADTRRAIRETAALVGREQQADELIARMDAALDAIQARVRGRQRPDVAVVVGYQPLVLAGPASYLGDLVELAGGRNVATGIGGQWPRVNWEFLLASAPEVIVDLSSGHAGMAEAGELPERWARYASLPAVADGRVHGTGGTYLLRPGPRLAQAAEALSRLVQPEAWTTEP
jgi:iron complex transport system substrate-binding protein